MIRWIVFIVALAAAAGFSGWLAQNPGVVTLAWRDYRADTSVAVLVAVIVLLIIVSALLYRLWGSVIRAPGSILKARSERRQLRGYEALTRGLVAIAAGDPEVARRQARRAEALLNDRPLTMLLSAQAAQLAGDEQAAERFFAAMRERSDTEFLGVRGLMTQAIKRQDWPEALTLARRAYRLNPRSEWVVSNLLELEKRSGRWVDAEATLTQAAKMKLVPEDRVPRQRAELQYQQSISSTGAEAIRWAKMAFRSDPGFVPGAVRLAKLLNAEGKGRRAAAVIERAWEYNPSPELADVYWEAKRCDDALKKVQEAQRLAKRNPDHLESRIIVAIASLEARLWGEARSQLEPVAGDNAPPRVCRLMAEVEEAEHGDLARARSWLLRASADEHGPIMSSPVPQV
jgi:HemY protein